MSSQQSIEWGWRQIARRIVASICDRIRGRLFVTLACGNGRTISDTQPGRERPPNRRWGEGPGSGGGVAHVPAALRNTVCAGRNRRRDDSRIARLSVGKRPQRNQIRGRDALVESTHQVGRTLRYSPSTSPSQLCQAVLSTDQIDDSSSFANTSATVCLSRLIGSCWTIRTTVRSSIRGCRTELRSCLRPGLYLTDRLDEIPQSKSEACSH